MKVRNYQELIVWQKAMDLVEEIYAVSKTFPREEFYGLTSQLRRAAVFNPFEHRRRARQANNGRFHSAPIDVLRIAAGARNTNTNRGEVRVFDGRAVSEHSEKDRGSWASTQWAHGVAGRMTCSAHSPLHTAH
jgi:hypothetical protein